MTAINETQLPGVGIRHDFVTRDGDRVGVISHHNGRRDLLIYDREDPDSCEVVMPLTEDDSHSLSEMLGGSQVVEDVQKARLNIGGLLLDWIPIRESWACSGQNLQELDVRAKTGVSVVAVVRGDEVLPSPGADFKLFGGDTAVVIGTTDGIQRAYKMLQGD